MSSSKSHKKTESFKRIIEIAETPRPNGFDRHLILFFYCMQIVDKK